MNEELKDLLKEMKHDMEYNRQTMPADYPYMKLIKILEILTHK